MLCSKCGKNEAVYHNSLVVNGIVVDEHLCSDCNGTKSKSNYFNPIITGHCCKTCGCTFEEFSASGLLGCTDCYNSFREELSSINNIRCIEKKSRGITQVFQKKNKSNRLISLITLINSIN